MNEIGLIRDCQDHPNFPCYREFCVGKMSSDTTRSTNSAKFWSGFRTIPGPSGRVSSRLRVSQGNPPRDEKESGGGKPDTS